MQADPNSHQHSQKDAQAQGEMTDPLQNTSSVEQPPEASAGSRSLFPRRSFIGRAGLFTATGVAAGVMSPLLSSTKKGDVVQAQEVTSNATGAFDNSAFVQKAYHVRVQAAKQELTLGIGPHPTNGDEERYPNKISNDSRGLPHDESFVIPNPVVPDPNDPTQVIPYSGPPLTVGGELNKLATNLAIGRDIGGIHWRSDVAAGLAVGEEVAIGILRDEKLGYAEKFDGFTLTKFDGTKITI